MSVPRGIPSVTYLRINSNSNYSHWVDVVSDGPNSVTVLDKDKVGGVLCLLDLRYTC